MILRNTRPVIFWIACLIPVISSSADAKTLARRLAVGGAGSMIWAAKSFSEGFKKAHPGVSVAIEPGSSRSAVSAVRAGKLAIGLMGHAIAPADMAGLYLAPIEKQPILLLTYSTNPVSNLSLAQIRQIYLGHITNWAQVGGENQAIVPFTRRKNSMIRQIFMGFVVGEDPAAKEKAFRIAKDKVLKTIKKIQGALGFDATSVEKAASSGVKVLSVNGNPPTRQNVQRGTYPFSRTLFVIAAEPPDGLVLEWIKGFVTFIRKQSAAHQP